MNTVSAAERSAGRGNRAILGIMDRPSIDPSRDLHDREIDRGEAWRRSATAAIQHLADTDIPGSVRAALQLLACAVEADAIDRRGIAPAAPVRGEQGEVWPRLTEFAQVHGTVFPPGTSTQSVIAEAVRYYQFEQQPPRVASRASVLERFGEQVGAIMAPDPKAD